MQQEAQTANTLMAGFLGTQRRNQPLVRRDLQTGFPWLNYDVNNDYPSQLKDLLKSSTHHSILISKRNATLGDGLYYDKSISNERNAFLDTIGDDYDVNELIRRTAFDLAMYGGFYWEIILNKNSNSIANICHMPFDKVRIENPNLSKDKRKSFFKKINKDVQALAEARGEIPDLFYVSQEWELHMNHSNYYPKAIPKFKSEYVRRYKRSESDIKEITCLNSYIFYYHEQSPLIDYYPTPDYFGGIDAIYTDIEIGNFHYNNTINGFYPSGAIIIPGDLSQQEKDELRRDLERDYLGTSNAGKVLIIFGKSSSAEGDYQYPKFETVATTNNADIYNVTASQIQQQILTAHLVTSPVLVGLQGEGGLGGNASEIVTAHELWHDSVIVHYKRPILSSLKKMLKVCGYAWQDIDIPQSLPVKSIYSEAIQRDVLSRNEIRKNIGYNDTSEPALSSTAVDAGTLFGGMRPFTTNDVRQIFGYPPLTDEELREQEKIDSYAQLAPHEDMYTNPFDE